MWQRIKQKLGLANNPPPVSEELMQTALSLAHHILSSHRLPAPFPVNEDLPVAAELMMLALRDRIDKKAVRNQIERLSNGSLIDLRCEALDQQIREKATRMMAEQDGRIEDQNGFMAEIMDLHVIHHCQQIQHWKSTTGRVEPLDAAQALVCVHTLCCMKGIDTMEVEQRLERTKYFIEHSDQYLPGRQAAALT